MTVSLRHLKRYADIARLLSRYGRSLGPLPGELADLDGNFGLAGEAPAEEPRGEELALELEKLGPTFVKLGQVLSTRPDLLPVSYVEALARLQDDVEPFPFAAVETIVESELGVRMSRIFADFEPAPIAAASLGQVHRATLRDGRTVAVKVQRPGVHEVVADDLAALREAAELLDAHTAIGRRYAFTGLVEEFRKSLSRELDYRLEAQNLVELAKICEPFPRVFVPQPVADFSSSRVLTMDFVHGRKITDVSPLARIDLDGAALADQLFRAYLHQILVAGFFHADPHPGNVFLATDGRLALLDLGMVGRVSPRLQERILRLLLATSEGKGEEAAAIAAEIGEKGPDYDEARFLAVVRERVTAFQGRTLKDVALGRVMLQLSQDAASAGARLPAELTLLGKTLLQLDDIGRCLDPGFDPNEAIRRHAAEITTERIRKQVSPGNLLAGLIDLKEFAERLPARANKILDRIANNELEVRVNAIDERLLMEGFQKVANRIAVGLILAALIVGAAMLMRVPTSFRLFGYPGFAILCFCGAAMGGLLLVGQIYWNDQKPRGPRAR